MLVFSPSKYPIATPEGFVCYHHTHCPRSILFQYNKIRSSSFNKEIFAAQEYLMFPRGLYHDRTNAADIPGTPCVGFSYQETDTHPVVVKIVTHPSMYGRVFKRHQPMDDDVLHAGFLADTIGHSANIIYTAPLTVSAYGEASVPRYSVFSIHLGDNAAIQVNGEDTSHSPHHVLRGMRQTTQHYLADELPRTRPAMPNYNTCMGCGYLMLCNQLDSSKEYSMAAIRGAYAVKV